MITLTMVCDRCSKEEVEDLSNTSFTGDDVIRKAGFHYVNDGRTNIMICSGCNNQFKELKGMQEEQASSEVCLFFDNCEEWNKNGYNSGAKNDRI